MFGAAVLLAGIDGGVATFYFDFDLMADAFGGRRRNVGDEIDPARREGRT